MNPRIPKMRSEARRCRQEAKRLMNRAEQFERHADLLSHLEGVMYRIDEKCSAIEGHGTDTPVKR